MGMGSPGATAQVDAVTASGHLRFLLFSRLAASCRWEISPRRFSDRNEVVDHADYLQNAHGLEHPKQSMMRAVSNEPEEPPVQEVNRLLLGVLITHHETGL